MTRARSREWVGLVVAVGVCLGVAAVGGWFTSMSVDSWYVALEKPVFTPPAWVFGPVWTILYVMMGVAVWQVWRQPRRSSGAMALFSVQLAFNLAWSALFFGLRSPAAGLVVIVVLVALIAATTGLFARHSRLAATLMLPYLAWVAFATALNASIWWLNR